MTTVSNVRGAFVSCAVILLLASPSTGHAQSTVEGVWINGDGDGWIELVISNAELNGKIIGSPDDPNNKKPSRRDDKNPDAALRSRPVRGLTILYGFHADGDQRWSGGRVYDPNSGNTYSGTITLIDAETLKLRGYIGIPLFGRTEIWIRRAERELK